jgi:DNA helicase-2/ATP-dependent DNA helicase PcrA
MAFTQEQEDFINFDGTESVILDATAGSGKTHSCVGRMKKLIERGVDPKHIIFFSFTNDAVNELKSRIGEDTQIKITTIHSFTFGVLAAMGKYKDVATVYDFIKWYLNVRKPKATDSQEDKSKFFKLKNTLYEEADYISSQISSYKLSVADNIPVKGKPKYFDEYKDFLKQTKSRDFSDMLIETYALITTPMFIKKYVGKYKHIFIDEYQDTSTIQLRILLAIKADQYYLTGDESQAIYGFSGANCKAVQNTLKQNKETIYKTLSINFRSDINIVKHSNNYSNLFAYPNSKNNGKVLFRLLTELEFFQMLQSDVNYTVLARTNAVIKDIEKKCLKNKIKMKYFNYFKDEEIEILSQGKINDILKEKTREISPYYGSTKALLNFIDENKDSKTFITSIHKSKGREFDNVILINSLDPELIEDKPEYDMSVYSFLDDNYELDIESRNVHYVGVTRPKYELYFMAY